MSLSDFAIDDSIEKEIDSVGGNGPVDSGLYGSTITMAYRHQSASGAHALVLHLATEGGRELRETIYFTSGTAKGGKHYFERNGVRNYLPGFNLINGLCLLTVAKNLAELDAVTKVVPIYSYDDKKEMPTEVPVLTDLLGQEIIAGVIKLTENKQVKNDADDYVDSPDGATRDKNTIDKFFRAKDQLTTAEILAGETDAGFYTTWGDRHNGVTKNTVRPVDAANSAFGAGAAAAKPQKSIFA
jgi:hypothetical protein